MSQHALHGEMGLARIGWAKNSKDASAIRGNLHALNIVFQMTKCNSVQGKYSFMNTHVIFLILFQMTPGGLMSRFVSIKQRDPLQGSKLYDGI